MESRGGGREREREREEESKGGGLLRHVEFPIVVVF